MIAAVFDCMVFLQAATNDRGPAFACLELAEKHQIILHVSPVILAEVRDVLTRPKIQAKFPHLTPGRIDVFLQKVASLSVLTDAVLDAGFMIRDANDLPYLNLAVARGAEYLVSRDNDLLDLMNDPSFISQFPQMQIVDPIAFLTRVRDTENSSQPEVDS